MNLDFYQFGYVTNDIEKAKSEIEITHGLKPMVVIENIAVPFVEAGEIRMHIAFGWKAGAQFELIEPVGGNDALYRNLLRDPEYSLVLHHVGRNFSNARDLEAALDQASKRWDLVLHGQMTGGCYNYFDSRGDRGYYFELSMLPEHAFPPGALG